MRSGMYACMLACCDFGEESLLTEFVIGCRLFVGDLLACSLDSVESK